jgi:malate synthase
VAHPGLVATALEIFNEYMPAANQIDLKKEMIQISEADLIKPVAGEITEKGLRINIEIGIRYLESWLRGVGCVPLNNLMEDAATAEISRAQVWQWLRHEALMSNGQKVTPALVQKIFDEEMLKIKTEFGEAKYSQSQFNQASQLFLEMIFNKEFPEFLTLAAYQFID